MIFILKLFNNHKNMLRIYLHARCGSLESLPVLSEQLSDYNKASSYYDKVGDVAGEHEQEPWEWGVVRSGGVWLGVVGCG